MSALQAGSAPGEQLVALADDLAVELGSRAAEHDREASFPFEGFAALKERGCFAAAIPEELGGLGVTSLRDLLVASTRLARGDPSLTLGVNMHFVYLANLVRVWRRLVVAGHRARADSVAHTLEAVARDRTVFAAAISEPRQDLTRPATTATRTDDGWVVVGRKAFCTMSPAADVFYTAVSFGHDDGRQLYGYALVPRGTAGVVVHDDWDALGMRASGSNSVSFDDVRLPRSALRGGFGVGDTVEFLRRNLDGGLFHAAVSLGIAEDAHELVVSKLAGRGAVDSRTRVLVAENAVDLAAARAVFSRAAELLDDHFGSSRPAAPTSGTITALFAEAQKAKAFVVDAAVRIADRALAVSGGAGYMSGSPLARACRDVRAAAFMNPLGAGRAYEFLADLTLGGTPALH
jgi:alkylation response protein AidB-like acyl-CoA dehydrogenase